MKMSPYTVAGISRRPRHFTVATMAELIDAFNKVCEVVASDFDTEPESIMVKSRQRKHTEPRQIVMYLLHYGCGYGTSSIGDVTGGYNHTTVNFSIETVDNLKKSDKGYQARMQRIFAALLHKYPEILIVGRPIV